MVDRPKRLQGTYFDCGLNFELDIRLTQKTLCFSNCRVTKLCQGDVIKNGNITKNSRQRIKVRLENLCALMDNKNRLTPYF